MTTLKGNVESEVNDYIRRVIRREESLEASFLLKIVQGCPLLILKVSTFKF
jgi:hypothetical protein